MVRGVCASKVGEMSETYRKILVALMKHQLRDKIEELAGAVGPEFEGVDTTDPDVRSVFLEILGQAFYDLHNELLLKIQKK